jgi:hypothetical protein
MNDFSDGTLSLSKISSTLPHRNDRQVSTAFYSMERIRTLGKSPAGGNVNFFGIRNSGSSEGSKFYYGIGHNGGETMTPEYAKSTLYLFAASLVLIAVALCIFVVAGAFGIFGAGVIGFVGLFLGVILFRVALGQGDKEVGA